MISDNGKCWIDPITKKPMISYTAIKETLPGHYRETLKHLGRNCILSRDKGGYIKAFNELELYERKLREEFGCLVTREEFKTTFKYEE